MVSIKHTYQSGLVLLALVIFLAFAIISYAFSELSVAKIKEQRAGATLSALQQGKQAIIDYAITYSDRSVDNDYGLFPNPETFLNGRYGNMSGSAGSKNVNIIEWLPWRTLDLDALKDESGTCLFYAVSGSYRLNANQSDMINEDSYGQLQIVDAAGNVVEGLNPEDRVVALVIAPGEVLAGQARNPLQINSNCGDDYGNNLAYLEGNGVYDNSTVSSVPDDVDLFIHATATSRNEAIPYNDKFLSIKRDDIWPAIVSRSDFQADMNRLTQALAECMAEYANLLDNSARRLAWPASVSIGPDRIDYRDNNNYIDTDGSEGYSGRYPYVVTNSNNAINSVALTEPVLFDIPGMCNNLGVDWEGEVVNLSAGASKYRKLWDNWKDHFFYIISKSYEPDIGSDVSCMDAGVDCISVNGAVNVYAGAVIFSGSRLAGAARADITVLADYLEDGKADEFILEADVANRTGDRDYVYTSPAASPDTINDVMYCIRDQPSSGSIDLDVIECSL